MDNVFILGDLIDENTSLTGVFIKKGYRREYKQGMPIVLQGQLSNELFFLAKGTITSSILNESGAKKIISIHLGKCILGTENINDNTASLSYYCHSDCEIYTYSIDRLHELSQEQIVELFMYSINISSRYFNHMRMLSGQKSGKLLKSIITEYECIRCKYNTEYTLTQQTLAEMIGISKTRVSELLAELSILDESALSTQ